MCGEVALKCRANFVPDIRSRRPGRRALQQCPPNLRYKDLPGLLQAILLNLLIHVEFKGIPKRFVGQVLFLRLGVPRPRNHTFRNIIVFGLAAEGGRAFFGVGTPGLQKNTWQNNHFGIPLKEDTRKNGKHALGKSFTTLGAGCLACRAGPEK